MVHQVHKIYIQPQRVKRSKSSGQISNQVLFYFSPYIFFGLAVTPPPPERMTPVKHALPHVIARFSPGGQLIKVLPNVPSDGMPAVVEIHNIEVRVNEYVGSNEWFQCLFGKEILKGKFSQSFL